MVYEASKHVSLLQFVRIHKKFKRKKVLEDVNIRIEKGEFVTLLGMSGCGKSTLLKILIGTLKQDKGQVLYEGGSLRWHLNALKRNVGYVSQDNSFYEKLTVEENLKFYAKCYGVSSKDIKERMKFLLDFVDLEHLEGVVCSRLSGGMKRRLEFALALIHDPDILILDEPFTGLDLSLKKQLWKLVEQIKEGGVTILLTTHLVDEVEPYYDRALVIHNKTKFFEITPEDVKKKNSSLAQEFLEVVQ